MSQENVEIVSGMLHGWASGDRDVARAAFDPRVLFITPIPDDPVTVGIPAMERALAEWRRPWVEWRFEIEETFDGGDHIVVITRQGGKGQGSGAEVEFVSFGVYSLRNAKVIRVEMFASKKEALEAAGLSE